jgi:hypothetical protein
LLLFLIVIFFHIVIAANDACVSVLLVFVYPSAGTAVAAAVRCNNLLPFSLQAEGSCRI